MRRSTHSAVAALTAVLAALGLWTGAVLNAAFAHAATALIMGGTSHPLSIPQDTTEFITDYVGSAELDFIAPSWLCDSPCSLVAVYTPEEFKFVTGIFDMTFDQSVAAGLANLNECITGNACTVTMEPYLETGMRALADNSYLVYAYSESSTIASKQKLDLIAHPVDWPVSFLMLANPNRPNGGILERFVGAYIPILGVTFNGATPTFSPKPAPLETVDIARQYDGWADFPTNPLNLIADINALMGTTVLHGDYFDAATPQLQGQYQDTTYYLIPTPIVPLLAPLTWVPLVGRPLAMALDPAIRVLIEMGYDRTVNPGQPTPARYFYLPDLVKAAVDLVVAIPTGVDNAISYLTGDPDCRPFHTELPASPFGVGGPPVYAGAVDPYGEPAPYISSPADADIAAVSSEAPAESTATMTADDSEDALPADFNLPPVLVPDNAAVDTVGDEISEALSSETLTPNGSSVLGERLNVQPDSDIGDPGNEAQAPDAKSEPAGTSPVDPEGDSAPSATDDTDGDA